MARGDCVESPIVGSVVMSLVVLGQMWWVRCNEIEREAERKLLAVDK